MTDKLEGSELGNLIIYSWGILDEKTRRARERDEKQGLSPGRDTETDKYFDPFLEEEDDD